MTESKDTEGNPLLGPNNYGIFSKMILSKPVHLKFMGHSKLEIKETGILGMTLINKMSVKDSNQNQLAVLNITSQYRKDFNSHS